MCGIAGFTHIERPFPPEGIQKAISSIAHRGPDQQGVWQNQALSLGANRLKVIDTCAGAQPMSSGDNDFTLVFNGEIYSHVELRRQLIGLRRRASSPRGSKVSTFRCTNGCAATSGRFCSTHSTERSSRNLASSRGLISNPCSTCTCKERQITGITYGAC